MAFTITRQNNILRITSSTTTTKLVLIDELVALNSYNPIFHNGVAFIADEVQEFTLNNDGVYKITIDTVISEYIINIFDIDKIKESYVLNSIPCNPDRCKSHYSNYDFINFTVYYTFVQGWIDYIHYKANTNDPQNWETMADAELEKVLDNMRTYITNIQKYQL